MQANDVPEPAVEVFFRFQVKDPETGQPYTVTISQEGVVREAAGAEGTSEEFDCCYQSHVNADLQVELLSKEAPRATDPTRPGPQPAIHGHHDLRQLLHQ